MENGYPLTITSGETMIVAGTLAFMSGGINSGTIEARGNATVASAYSGGSTFLAFTGSNTQSFNLTGATGNYDGKITVNKTGGQVNLLSALVMDAANQDLTIQQGTFNLNGNDLNVNGTSARLIVNNTGNLQLKGSETITVNSSYPQLDAGSTVTYYGTSGPYTIKNYTYSNLIINGSGATFSLSNTLDVNGSFTLLNGTFSPVSYNMTVGGNWLNSGGTYTAGTSSVTFDGTAAGNTITTAASPFYNLTINGSGGAWTLQDALTISNILTISSGTVTQGNNAITSSAITQNGGTFTGNSSVSPVNITITGDVSLSGGSFTSTQGMFDIGGNFSQVFSAFNHNSGTIDLNGTGTQTCLAVGTLNNVIHSGAGTLQLIPLIRSYPDWLYRDKIILSPTIVSNTDQTDFPLLIKFATHNGLRDHAQANFNDVFFTSSDRTTKLSHEIEKYDKSTGELWAWVKIPVLSSSANTILYMYYGNPGASNQRDGIHVWDANFKAVYHLGENGSPYNDVTSNANNSMGGTNPSQIDAVVGKGENFNGSSQDISFPQIFSTSSETTVSIWVKFNTLPSVSGHYNAIIGKSHNGSDFDLLTSPLDNKFYWYGGATVSSTTTVADINTWYYVVATFKSNNYVKVYINGNYENQGATGSGQIGNTNALDIGQSGVWPGRWLGGIADEARVSTVARSADWIKTEYNNQHNPTAYQSIGYDTPYTGLNLAGNLTNSAGTLDASNQNIILAGNWINSAIFIPGTDTVILNGINQNIFGTTGFSNLKKSVSSAGILGLEKGKTTTINSLATLNGTVGNLLSIRTVDAGGTVLNDGSQATIDFKGTTSTGYLDVRDNIAASSNSAVTLPIEPPNSTDAGNTVNWFCTRVTVSGSSGANGIYTSLTNASGAFAAINTTPQTGNTILITFACSSTAETGTISLTAGTWTSLTMYPVTLGLTISGNPSEPYITLDGADYVTIDGRLNGSGVTKTLTISKIQFINSAVNDIIKYCSIAGDFSVSGTSSATLDGETTVGGNLKIEGGSNLSTTPASDLTISGTLTIRP